MKNVYTVGQISKMTGTSESTIRQHISRGRLAVEKDGTRTYVTQAALDAYLAEDALTETAAEVRKPGADVPREIGNMISRLPAHVAEAILSGIPTSKKAGSPDAFHTAIEQLLDDASWTWNGAEWVGTRDGTYIGHGIAPSHPWADKRPLAPAKKVTK